MITRPKMASLIDEMVQILPPEGTGDWQKWCIKIFFQVPDNAALRTFVLSYFEFSL